MQPVIIPADLQPDVDAVVEAMRAGKDEASNPSFDRVTSWCEVHSDESGFYSGDHGESFPIVSVETELARCSEDDLRFSEGLDDDAELPDATLAAFVRERLAGVLDGRFLDADVHPMGCELRVAATDGTIASLCYLLSGYSFGDGPQVEWMGAYASIEDFRAEMRGGHVVTSAEELARITDAALLELWRRQHS